MWIEYRALAKIDLSANNDVPCNRYTIYLFSWRLTCIDVFGFVYLFIKDDMVCIVIWVQLFRLLSMVLGGLCFYVHIWHQ